MTKSLASELAPAGIYVNCVAPGWVDTDMSAATIENPKTGEVIRRTIPLGRVARPEEIAALFAYLASNDAAYVTGQVFTIDGGEIAGGLASR